MNRTRSGSPAAAYVDRLRDDIVWMGTIVGSQMTDALDAFQRNDFRLAESVIEKDDQVDSFNLKVESLAFDAAGVQGIEEAERRAIISALKVAINLERIGDTATHIAKRISLISRDGIEPLGYDWGSSLDLVVRSIHDAVRAYLDEDLELAKRACELEPVLDGVYVEGMHHIAHEVERYPSTIGYYLHLTSVLKYLEKVGDYVLNIGEQAIYLITGNRLHFSQFQQLDHLLQEVGAQKGYAPFSEGISGSVVAQIQASQPFVYKEGSQRKIAEEIASTDAWSTIDPSLVPQVVSVTAYEDRQALLREFVDGSLLSQIYESGDAALQRKVTDALCGTLDALWRRTLRPSPPKPSFVRQIRTRLAETYALHPPLEAMAARPMRSKGRTIPPLEEALNAVEELEPSFAPPFSVWLHGDLNANNIVYGNVDHRLKFIDIHRSEYGDYVQDLSVFLVGLERQPGLSPLARRQADTAARRVTRFASEFASHVGDDCFERRLNLGLGRSYLTSARVILHPGQAENLFRRGRVRLQGVLDGQA